MSGITDRITVAIPVLKGPLKLDGNVYDGFACGFTIEGIGQVIVMAATKDLAAGICEVLTGVDMDDEKIVAAVMGSLLKTTRA